MAFDPMTQRLIMGRFATGITVVTTGKDNEMYGMTANAVTSLSFDPPLVLVAVDRRGSMHAHLKQNAFFAVNILRADQEAISRRFAAPGPKDFSDLTTTTAATGAPILSEAIAHVDCRVVEVLPGGDHDIFIGEILAGDAQDGRPLLFYAGKYGRLTDG